MCSSDLDKDLADTVSWSAMTLTIARNGGASAADGFVATGGLAALVGGTPLVLDGVTVGWVTTNAGGVLQLAFGVAADAARVDAVLESLAYRPLVPVPATVLLNWVLDDGTGEIALGTTVVTVLAEIAPVVNSTGDDPDLSPGDLVCDTGALNAEGDPECTLRAALQEANGFGDADVTFAIPVTDPGYDGERWTIALGTALPAVTATPTAAVNRIRRASVAP